MTTNTNGISQENLVTIKINPLNTTATLIRAELSAYVAEVKLNRTDSPYARLAKIAKLHQLLDELAEYSVLFDNPAQG